VAVRLAVAASVVLLAASVAGAPMPSVPGIVAQAAPDGPAPPPEPRVPAAPGQPADGVPSRAPGSLVLLQMNLCNSGMAVSCFTFGQAVDDAAAKIRRHAPDLVMVQEICRDDLYAGDGWGKLAQAMADAYGRDQVAVSFVPAKNRFTGGPYLCLNGEQFGIALMHHDGGRGARHGWYRSQDQSDEVRAWTCATVIEGRLTACTTHLSTHPEVAMRQCRELVSTLESPWVMPEVIVAGDFNLRSEPGKAYDIRGCLPGEYLLRGDGGLQQVFFSTGIQWLQGRTETWTGTDHPLLYQQFRI